VHDVTVYRNRVLSSYTAKKRYIRQGDIHQFSEKKNYDWILKNIPMNQKILTQFVKAGYLINKSEKSQTIFLSETLHNGVISPIISNMVRDGFEPMRLKNGYRTVRYANDFVVLGESKESLEKAKLSITSFLSERGLTLNPEKTTITHISEGFDFLDFHFREYPDQSRIKGTKEGIFLIKPSHEEIQNFRKNLKTRVKEHSQKPTYLLVNQLNQKLRRWAEHYRSVTSKKVFSSIGRYVWILLWNMITKKHKGQPLRQLKHEYFIKRGGNNWVFFCKDSRGEQMTLFQIGWVKIKRHSLCLSQNPFLPENADYFAKRMVKSAKESIQLNQNASNLLKKQAGQCPVCLQPMCSDQNLEVHHILPKKLGGEDEWKNLVLLHRDCHVQVTHSKSPKLIALWKEKGIIK